MDEGSRHAFEGDSRYEGAADRTDPVRGEGPGGASSGRSPVQTPAIVLARPAEPAPASPPAPASDTTVTAERQAAPATASTPAPAAAVAPAAPAKAPRRKRRWLRRVLFLLLPVALGVGAYEYVIGGQVMSTDNAYVQARTLGVSTDVSGTVLEVAVHDNERVTKGQVLFRLRPDSFRIALDGAKAQLETVRNQVMTLQATYKQSLAQIAQAKADLPYYESVFKRQQDLMSTNVASRATFDQAQHDLVSVRQRITVAEAQAASMLAQLGGDANQTIEQNPFYLQAKSMVDAAQRDLNDTVVRAPFDGVVTNVDALQIGAYLKASAPAFNLVSATDLWVEANPKETELTYVHGGQTATVTVDTYPGTVWHGRVESISPASASSFSLLPAQNSSGNWVKVVQRIPMRVHLDDVAGKPPLRVGMSVVVDIDTGHARGIPEFAKPLADTLAPRVAEAAAAVRPLLARLDPYIGWVTRPHG